QSHPNESRFLLEHGASLPNGRIVDDPASLAASPENRQAAGLWRMLLWAVLGCLLIETVFAWRFGQKHEMEAPKA
ncbi:MAG: hypothetical protein KDB53_11490, partial [Planctomycetes bacterium]|nr:hypothetical protein [Planctomycetota bacterium]